MPEVDRLKMGVKMEREIMFAEMYTRVEMSRRGGVIRNELLEEMLGEEKGLREMLEEIVVNGSFEKMISDELLKIELLQDESRLFEEVVHKIE